jgi:hypothetical protein
VSITKVVGFFISNPTKLSLHFSEFSTILHGFYKIQQNLSTIEVSLFSLGPWKELGSHRCALGLQINP